MRRYATAFAVVLSFVGLALTAEDITRVIRPPAELDDIRIKKPFHVDNPYPFEPRFPDRQAWERRAEELRTQVLVANGLWPMPPKTPLNPVMHGKIDRDGYTVEKVYFASLPGHYVTGNLYRPKGMPGRRPGVLCPHGHWANGRLFERSEAEAKQEIESGAESTLEGARYPLQARCAMLARMGCVVFMYDMVGYADSTKIPHTQGFSDAEADLRLQSFMGLQTWNSIRALDFLTSLDDVDPQRIGVTGASGGGTQTFILCAVDPRPAVSFPAVMVSTAMQGGCICENCSLLRIGTNNIELAALFAPKPQAMTGADDWTKEIERKGLPELKRIYGLYGAADRVEAKYLPFPHNYNQPSREMMYNWFNRYLNLGVPEPVKEQPFVPIPPKDLRVFDAEHPVPADAADAPTLRHYLTRTAEAQLRELAKQPEEYRRVVSAALRAMVVDHLPEQEKVKSVLEREIAGDGFKVRQMLLTRDGTQEYVPALAVIPENWQGEVVVVTDSKGKGMLFEKSGRPGQLLRRLLDARKAVVAPDVYLTGEFFAPGQEPKLPPLEQKYHRNVPFAGYTYGYNRTVLANRVRDTLTTLAYARRLNGERPAELLALGDAAVWALLARLLAGEAVSRAVLDLNGFDFDQVKRPDDAMMLPGALKYGGIHGFLPLCPNRDTIIFGIPKGEPLLPVNASLHREPATLEAMAARIVER